jgi:ribosome biogenesis GTPase
MSAKKPDFSSLLLDMFLAVIRQSFVDPVIVISKIDLMTKAEMTELEAKLTYYRQFCPIVYVDSLNREGIAPIFPLIQGRINIVAGQTGAGKSSLLNAINPLLHLKTDEISEALGRGKHTTRHVELMPFMGGLIADTPGFSKLTLTEFDPKSLKDVYPDFVAVADSCRFLGCIHDHEPGCAVKRAVEEGRILPERYQNYLKLHEEIKHIKTKYPR